MAQKYVKYPLYDDSTIQLPEDWSVEESGRFRATDPHNLVSLSVSAYKGQGGKKEQVLEKLTQNYIDNGYAVLSDVKYINSRLGVMQHLKLDDDVHVYLGVLAFTFTRYDLKLVFVVTGSPLYFDENLQLIHALMARVKTKRGKAG